MTTISPEFMKANYQYIDDFDNLPFVKSCRESKPNKEKEMQKVWKDVRETNFGIFDPEIGLRVNPKNLAFFWNGGDEIHKMKEEIHLRRSLTIIQEIYKEKFGDKDPYDFALYKQDVGVFLERMIRAVEICTLKYVLNTGGALNIDKKFTVTMGRERFLWEP